MNAIIKCYFHARALGMIPAEAWALSCALNARG